MRLAWLTDIHLNFVTPAKRAQFIESVVSTRPDGILLGGDIAEAQSVEDSLCLIAESFMRPVYFVLGNHDFYGGSITGVRKKVGDLCRRNRNLVYLTQAGAVTVSEQTALVGHDSWADGRLGDYESSDVFLNDYIHILELAGLDKASRLRELNRLGDEAASHLRKVLTAAFANRNNVILLTHVPPFAEAAWHEGRTSDSNHLPHFASGAVGEMLREIMPAKPESNLTVLCGHTHGAGTARVLPNLRVRTGGADYGAPALQGIIEV